MKTIISMLFTALTFLTQTPAGAQQRSASSQLVSRDSLVWILGHAIELNEGVKDTLFMSPILADSKWSFSSFTEDVLFPILPEIARTVSDSADTVLFCRYLDMIVSFENVASENPGYYLAKMFSVRPQIFTQGLVRRSTQDRNRILGSLEFGLLNLAAIERFSEVERNNIMQKFADLKNGLR